MTYRRALLLSTLSSLALTASPAFAQNQDPPAEQTQTIDEQVASGETLIVHRHPPQQPDA